MSIPKTIKLESDTEDTVVSYATNEGCLTLKLNVWGRRGWPDRIFVFRGKVLFVEFKREGEDLRKLQEYVHGKLREHGIKVYVVDNISDGEALIDKFTAGGSELC